MTQQTAPKGSNPFHVVLRGALLPAAAAGAAAAVVLGLARGPAGGISAAIGVLIALAFFASGLLVIARFVTDTNNPMLFMAVGMTVYFAQVLVLLGVLIAARRIDALDSWAAGVAMLVAVIVWQVAQMMAWRRARVPVYDTPEPGQEGDR
jgi:ATP synthase protein I